MASHRVLLFFFEDGSMVYPANAFDSCLLDDEVSLGSFEKKKLLIMVDIPLGPAW